MYKAKLCPCDSGLLSSWLHDAKGIPCCRVCEKCEADKRKKYRPEVLEDPDYESDEPIDED